MDGHSQHSYESQTEGTLKVRIFKWVYSVVICTTSLYETWTRILIERFYLFIYLFAHVITNTSLRKHLNKICHQINLLATDFFFKF